MKLALKFKPGNQLRLFRLKRREPDWFGWGLDYFVGFVLGVLMSFGFLVAVFPPELWIKEVNILPFLFGGGLFVGAVNAYCGERFPLGDGIVPQHFPPRAPGQSALSRLLSLIGGVTGVACMVYWEVLYQVETQ